MGATASRPGIISVQKSNCVLGHVTCSFSDGVDTGGVSLPSV